MNTQALQGIGMTSQRTRERLVSRLAERGIRNEQVLNAMRNVPRHLFVDEALASRAYEDSSLPIGCGQTISQPYVVARMTEVLMAVSPRKALEVGTGCGYQTAILSQLIPEVYSIERISTLHQKARRNLAELQLHNVRLRHGDGYRGWPAAAPFDAILVAAAPPEIPEALLKQLAEGGRLILPVGAGEEQELQLITRKGNQFVQEVLERVVFVPMLSGAEA